MFVLVAESAASGRCGRWSNGACNGQSRLRPDQGRACSIGFKSRAATFEAYLYV